MVFLWLLNYLMTFHIPMRLYSILIYILLCTKWFYPNNSIMDNSGISTCNSCTRYVCQSLYPVATSTTFYCSSRCLWRHSKVSNIKVLFSTLTWFDNVTNLVYILSSFTTWVIVSFVTWNFSMVEAYLRGFRISWISWRTSSWFLTSLTTLMEGCLCTSTNYSNPLRCLYEARTRSTSFDNLSHD